MKSKIHEFLKGNKTNIRKKSIIFIALTVLNVTNLLAWGKEGHQIVAEIAKHYLDKSVQDSVNKYLYGLTFEEASTWMDQIKSDHKYDYMKEWHYINIEKDATYVESKEKNVVTVLESIISKLNHKTKLSFSEMNVSIKMLFHLVGDLHQPLHVGYGDDRGGNDIHLKYLSKSKKNLHQVWDEAIIESQKITTINCLALAKNLSTAELKNLEHIDVIQWMNQSRALLPEVYAYQNGNLSKAYVQKNTAVIQEQLLKAGIRLAAVLNKTFKK